MIKLKPIVHYTGGKQKFSKRIVSNFPKNDTYNTYYEPFVGMGAVFLELQPKKAVISDINPDIVNIWKQLKTNCNTIIKYFKRFPLVDKENFKKICIYIENNQQTYGPKKAAYMLMFMKNTFHSYPRYNSSNKLNNGFFNSQKGNNNNHFLLENKIQNLKNISKYLKNNKITIKLCSFEKNIPKMGNNLIYLDPPYVTDVNFPMYKKNDNENPINEFIILSKNNKIFLSNNDHVFKKFPILKKYNKLEFKNRNLFRRFEVVKEVLIYN